MNSGKKVWYKILLSLSEHNSLIQLILFSIFIILQTIFSCTNMDYVYLIATGFVFIVLELFQISILLEAQNINSAKYFSKNLKKRTGDAIKEFAKSTKKEIFVTGINNHGIINLMYNDTDLLRHLCEKNIKLKLLFINAYNKDRLNWYCKSYLGNKYSQDGVNLVIEQFETTISLLKTYEEFRKLSEKSLLEIRLLDGPIFTTYIASDPKLPSGKLQCQFYQNGVITSDCPCIILETSDEMYDTLRDSLLEAWGNATPLE